VPIKNLIILSGLVLLTFIGLFPQKEQIGRTFEPEKEQKVQFESGYILQNDLLLTQPLTGFQFFSQAGIKTFSEQLSAALSQFHVLQSSIAVSRNHHHKWVSLGGVFYTLRLYLKNGVLIQ
jgi:hypothetical protein